MSAWWARGECCTERERCLCGPWSSSGTQGKGAGEEGTVSDWGSVSFQLHICTSECHNSPSSGLRLSDSELSSAGFTSSANREEKQAFRDMAETSGAFH